MDYHILNGMCLHENFPNQIGGKKIVMNEALLQGPLGGALPLSEFWQMRAQFWKVPLSDYRKKVVAPLQKLLQAKKEDTLIFWFGSDLFCQINVWFLLYFIYQHKINARIGFIYPPEDTLEEVFGHYPFSFLSNGAFNPIFLNDAEIKMAVTLWNLCKNRDFKTLKKIKVAKNTAFPNIKASIKMWIELHPDNGLGVAERKVQELLQKGVFDFKDLFTAFSKSFPTLGMGDTQVYEYYQKYVNEKMLRL